jgi:hypothetical protein
VSLAHHKSYKKPDCGLKELLLLQLLQEDFVLTFKPYALSTGTLQAIN